MQFYLQEKIMEKVKEVIGTCRSMGIKVEEKEASDAIALVNEGKFDKEIAAEKGLKPK
jgi:hypothetical protein